MQDSLSRLDRLLAERFPDIAAALRPGADDWELDEFEAEFGRVLPNELRDLYRWHDGADFDGYHSLPGIGHWRPLFLLPERCLEWQESWHLGFDPWWVPFTVEDYGQGVYVIDASGEPAAPARVLYYEIPDGVGRSCESVAAMIEQMIRLVEQDVYGRDEELGGYSVHGQADDGSTLFTGWRAEDQGMPEVIPPNRFSLPQRFDHEPTPRSDVRGAYEDLLAALRDLAAVAERDAGRDGRAVLPQISGIIGHYAGRAGAEEYALARSGLALRNALDFLWRLLRRNVPTERWEADWRAAEQLAIDLQHST